MPKRPQNYYRPQTLDEALELLKAPDAAPLAGGTRLLADDVQAVTVVDLQDLGLSGIAERGGELHIGATTTLTQIMESPDINGDAADVFQQAVHAAGANTFRNAATLGGVIASRDAQSELLAALLVLDARLVLADSEIPLRDYLHAESRPDGLITGVIVPWGVGRGALVRVARTPADAPIVAVAAWHRGAHTDAAQVAAVGIAARPVRLPDAWLDDIETAVTAAREHVTHPGDFLGSADYRRQMVGVLLKRALDAVR